MTRKDYVAFAEVIAATKAEYPEDSEARQALNILTGRIATVFQRDNYRFDRQRFHRAATPTEQH